MLNPTLVVVVDSSGALERWYESEDLWRLGDLLLPPRFIHVGRAVDGRDRLMVVPATGGGLGDVAGFTSAVASSLRLLTDAQATVEAVGAGHTVSERTVLMVIVRASDSLCDSLLDIVHDLHSVIARLFPALNAHVALTVLLPSLFDTPSDLDLARTYALLRRIDGSMDDPTALRIYDAPRRPFQSVWLANSINEDGRVVGQFPAATESLTGFLQALLLGAVTLPDSSQYLHGARNRSYATFGCSVLTAEREGLCTALAQTLYARLLPTLFGAESGSREASSREAERFAVNSDLDHLETRLESTATGVPLYQPTLLSWSRDSAKQTGTVTADLEEYRRVLEGPTLYDVRVSLERREQEVEGELRAALKEAAGAIVDRTSGRAAEWFLERLVADPPEDENPLGLDDRTTLFGLLGRAIARLDHLIGFSEPRDRLERLEDRIQALDQRRRELELESAVLSERISSTRLNNAGRPDASRHEPTLEQLSVDLEACQAKIAAVLGEASAVRAEYRGQLIADRGYHMGERQSAIALRRVSLEQTARASVDAYREAVSVYRDLKVRLTELYDSRRSWIVRTAATVPFLAALAALFVHVVLLMTPRVTLGDVASFYDERLGSSLGWLGIAACVYASVSAWIYWRRFAAPIAQAERELRHQDERVGMAADACATAERAVVEFLIQVARRDGVVRILMALRAYGRDVLLQRARAFREWISSPRRVRRTSRTLYRSSVWRPDRLERLLARALEGVDNVEAVFWTSTGKRSTWVFETTDLAESRLGAFAMEQFTRIGELNTEEMLFEPRFGLDKADAENVALSVDKAASPYLHLHDTNGTFDDRVVLTSAGSRSRVRDVLERHGIAATYPAFADDSRIVIVRTRQGFSASQVAEIRTYWHAYLSSASSVEPDVADPLPELIPLFHLEPYNRVAAAFLTLWASGRIVRDGEQYRLNGVVLCDNRWRFYAACVGNPVFRLVERNLVREAAGVSGNGFASASIAAVLVDVRGCWPANSGILQLTPIFFENRVEHLIEVLAVAEERLPQPRFLHGAELQECAVASPISYRRARFQPVDRERVEDEVEHELRTFMEHAGSPKR